MLHVAVLGSGRGSNFQAILDAVQRGELPNIRIRVVLSNNSKAGILDLARANSIPAVHVSQHLFPREVDFVDALLDVLRWHEVTFIVLAGYMKHLHHRVIAEYRNRIINIHPALLPKYGGRGMFGMHVHEAVIAHRERISGATVHLVDEEFDRGGIVLQKQVAIEPVDTPGSVAAKVLAIEHEIYPQALRMFAEGRVEVTKDGVTVHSLAS